MMWIIGVVVTLALLWFLMGFFCQMAAFGVRCEGDPDLKYFTHEDFTGLQAEPVAFTSDKGQTLRGALYTDQSVENPLGLVVFAHGMGGGHLSYTTEINTMAKAGFAVLSYDNTGTMASDGKALGGFYQAVKDLRAALAYVRANEKLSGYKVVLMGHSWGAYTVCQALAYEEPNVAGVVAFSPPNSSVNVISDTMGQTLGVSFGWLHPMLWAASVLRNGWDSRRKVSDVLKETGSVPVLILQGDIDQAVLLSNSPVSDPAVKNKENITAILYEGRAHNVYQTKESEKYLGERLGAINAAKKKHGKAGIPAEEKAQLYDIDYALITEEDSEVMKTVVDFVKDCVKE